MARRVMPSSAAKRAEQQRRRREQAAPAHPRPAGRAPKDSYGKPCAWDGELGIWRNSDGGEYEAPPSGQPKQRGRPPLSEQEREQRECEQREQRDIHRRERELEREEACARKQQAVTDMQRAPLQDCDVHHWPGSCLLCGGHPHVLVKAMPLCQIHVGWDAQDHSGAPWWDECTRKDCALHDAGNCFRYYTRCCEETRTIYQGTIYSAHRSHGITRLCSGSAAGCRWCTMGPHRSAGARAPAVLSYAQMIAGDQVLDVSDCEKGAVARVYPVEQLQSHVGD